MNKFGSNNYNYKGGRRKTSTKYMLIYAPFHPYKDANKCVREHRIVMEKHLGRYLDPKEVVHHINKNRLDNRIENLQLIPNPIEHLRMHTLGKHKDTSDRYCFSCGSYDTLMCDPKGKLKTPCPHWNHLPWDQVKWYCVVCYGKEMHWYKKSKTN